MKTIRQEQQARDIELMMNMVLSDPGHISRSKEKRARVEAEREAKNIQEAAKGNPETAILCAVCGVLAWMLALVLMV